MLMRGDDVVTEEVFVSYPGTMRFRTDLACALLILWLHLPFHCVRLQILPTFRI